MGDVFGAVLPTEVGIHEQGRQSVGPLFSKLKVVVYLRVLCSVICSPSSLTPRCRNQVCLLVEVKCSRLILLRERQHTAHGTRQGTRYTANPPVHGGYLVLYYILRCGTSVDVV